MASRHEAPPERGQRGGFVLGVADPGLGGEASGQIGMVAAERAPRQGELLFDERHRQGRVTARHAVAFGCRDVAPRRERFFVESR